MKVAIENLEDFFFSVDGENEYSAVLETEDRQVVIYAFNRQSSEIIKALIVPSRLSPPYDIDIIWSNDQCHIEFSNGWRAGINVKTKQTSTSEDFPGEWM